MKPSRSVFRPCPALGRAAQRVHRADRRACDRRPAATPVARVELERRGHRRALDVEGGGEGLEVGEAGRRQRQVDGVEAGTRRTRRCASPATASGPPAGRARRRPRARRRSPARGTRRACGPARAARGHARRRRRSSVRPCDRPGCARRRRPRPSPARTPRPGAAGRAPPGRSARRVVVTVTATFPTSAPEASRCASRDGASAAPPTKS